MIDNFPKVPNTQDIRNSIHNNGLHTKDNKQHSYKEQNYVLQKDTEIDFFTVALQGFIQ